MSKAPYLHSDGSDCYTKDCSLGNTSIHAPVKSTFAQALAAKNLTRPVEVEELVEEEDDDDWEEEEEGEEEEPRYDADGFLEDGILEYLCNAGTNGSPEVRSFLIEAGITEQNGWAADDGDWGDADYIEDIEFEGEADWIEVSLETGSLQLDIRTYDFVNAQTGEKFSFYGLQDGVDEEAFTSYISHGEALYEIWNRADDTQEDFEMDMVDSDIVEAIKFNPNPTFIRWAAANYSSSEVRNAIHAELTKMFPGSQEVPLDWLLKMME